MNKEQIKYLLRAQSAESAVRLISRDQKIPFDSGKIISLIGMRRVGKTYLLFQRMQELLASGVDSRQLIYINFEDDRIAPVTAGEMTLIPQAHGELYPELSDQRRYYFFDEIQNAPGWEKFCRRIHDTERAPIVVTGSSAHFLAREVATELRGRSIPIEIFPLSFNEFLKFRNVQATSYSAQSEQRLVAEVEAFLEIGGLPEVVLAEPSVRPHILREYADLIFYKDLVDRHRLANPLVMKQLLRYCLSAPASLVNVSKIYNNFKSQGLRMGKDTLHKYLGILEDSYLIYLLPIADKSFRKRAINPKKMHLIDWAIGYTYKPRELIDRGRKLENAVFLHERRRCRELAYLASPYEIDIVDSVDYPRRFLNVTWSLSDYETREREFRIVGIKNAEERIVISHENADQKFAPKGVNVLPAWKFFTMQ